MRGIHRKTTRRRSRRGVLTFEWILLISLLVIGIIGGLSAVRDALLCELNDLAMCIQAIEVCECPEDCEYPECCDTYPWCCPEGGP